MAVTVNIGYATISCICYSQDKTSKNNVHFPFYLITFKHTFCIRNFIKPRSNALDLSLYNARHSCIVKSRKRLATLYNEVDHVLRCRVKFDQDQNFAMCIVLSRAFGHSLYKVERAHAQFHHETCQIH